MQVTYMEELFVQHFTELHPYAHTHSIESYLCLLQWEIPDFEFVPDTILKGLRISTYGSGCSRMAIGAVRIL